MVRHNQASWFLTVALFFTILIHLPAYAANGIGPQWVLIGDQVANGLLEPGVIPNATSLYSNKVSEHANVTVVNLSTNSGYAHLPASSKLLIEAVPALQPEGVILALGSNDFGTGQNLTAVAAGVRAMVARLKELGIQKVVCLTPLNRYDWRTRRGPNPGQATAYGHTLYPIPSLPRATYYSTIANACAGAGAQVISGAGAIPVGSINSTYYGAPAGTTLYILLNTAGHARVAEWLAGRMKALGHWQ